METVKTYLGYLEDAHLVHRVENLSFKTKPKARERMGMKWYCADTGLRNAVARRSALDEGMLMENVVLNELVRRGETAQFWKGTREVGFVVGPHTGPFTPINVCYGEKIPTREVEGLYEFRKVPRIDVTDPLLLTKSTHSDDEGIAKAPLWRWLLKE